MTSEFAVGVHALVYLNHRAAVLSSEEIAKNVCTNPARVRKVLAKLKKAGLVQTKEGVSGGYQFVRNGREVDLCAVADALGETFVGGGWKSGNPELSCLISSGMAGLLDELYADLDAECRKRLKNVTIADFDIRIFGPCQGKAGAAV